MGGLRTDVERLTRLLPDPQGTAAGQVVTTTTYVDERGITQYSYTLAPGGGGGSGTVTSVSAGGLSPLFTSSVATPTTTPALTFTQIAAAANRIFAGPTTGAAANPTFRALVAADLPAGTGTVTSVALALPAEFTVSGSPVTTSGTLTGTKATQTANTVWAGPTTGSPAQPTFRALVAADIPSLPYGTVTSVDGASGGTGLTLTGGPITTSGTLTLGGTLAINHGGTGQTTAPLAFAALSPQTTKGDLIGYTSAPARIPVGTDGQTLLADSTQSAGIKWSASGIANAGIYYYGDGSDGVVLMDGTNTFAAFATKSGAVYTLTRDLYCDTLQINNSAQLKPNGFRIFCYTGIIDCTGALSPAIFCAGNVGGNATGASLGSGGALTSQAGTLGWGANGGTGTNGGTGAGGAGSTGARPNGTSNGGTGGPPSLVSASGGTGSGGAGGNQAAATATIPFVWRRPDADMYVISSVGSGTPPWSTLTAGGGGSGGGAGGGNAVQSGGGGGGGGGGGAVAYIAARNIYCGAYTLVSVNGAAGGNGGLGNATNTGGGGGGSGGGGGLFHCVYSTLSGPGGCTLTAIGGVGGTGAAGQGTGTAGKGGTGGSGGLILDFNIGTGVTTATPGVAGSANSGTTGGAGGGCTRTLTP